MKILVIDIRSKAEARTIAEALSSERPRFWARWWRGPAKLELEVASVVTWKQFWRALRKHAAPVVHIVGRNPEREAVELEDSDGVVRSVDRDMLAWCRHWLASVELVVLDGCYSRLEAPTWLTHVKAVIGIPASVTVEGSAQFASELYRALARKCTLPDAFDACRKGDDITLHIPDDGVDAVAHRTSAGPVDTLPSRQRDHDSKQHMDEDIADASTHDTSSRAKSPENETPVERLHDAQVLVIGIRSEDEARMVAESLPSEVGSVMVSVDTWEQFRQALRGHVAPILHIVDRSPGAENVRLEDADGVMQSADRDTLSLCRHELASVDLVILDGCYSRLEAPIWQTQVDAVIGIPASVAVAVGARFASELYLALARKCPLLDAFSACRKGNDITLHIPDARAYIVGHRTSAGPVDTLPSRQRDHDNEQHLDEDSADAVTHDTSSRAKSLENEKSVERLDDAQVLVIGIRSDDEARTIVESLPSEVGSVMVDVATRDQFRQALHEHLTPVVHIVARSSGTKAVKLEDANRVMRDVALYILEWCREQLAAVEVVVLDGFYNRPQARLWLRQVNAVIGIPESVPVNDGARFAGELYGALARKRTLQDAFDACRSDQGIELLTRKHDADRLVRNISGEMEKVLDVGRSSLDSKQYIGKGSAGTEDAAVETAIRAGELPKAHTLRELLLELRKGYTLYKPILIEVEPGSRITPEGTLDRTLTMRKHLSWAEQYSREYAGHAFLVLGPNTLSAGLETPVTLGRSRRCDVRIDNDSVSKVHGSVVFDRASGEYYLVDEFSNNGTCINGEELIPGVPAAIWSGAKVSFGDAMFVFIDPPTLRKMTKLTG